MSTSPLWAQFGLISDYLGRLIPLSGQPILVIGTARSGSSWVGDVLSQSPKLLYLREPLTQTVNLTGSKPRFQPFSGNHVPELYGEHLEHAFRGIPMFSERIVKDKKRWSLHKRFGKRILIKEVYLSSLAYVLKTYTPKVIYLLRHPAAVACSWHQLGFETHPRSHWPEEYRKRCEPENFWVTMGTMQAYRQMDYLKVLRNYPDKVIVKYEAICLNPVDEFKKLYEFIDLAWTNDIENYVQQISRDASKIESKRPFSIKRNSVDYIDAWRQKIEADNLEKIKSAYLACDPTYYQQDEW